MTTAFAVMLGLSLMIIFISHCYSVDEGNVMLPRKTNVSFIVLFVGAFLSLLLLVRSYFVQKANINRLKVSAEQLFVNHVAHQKLQERNKNLTDSILYARRIQQATLPELSDITSVFPESFVIYKPKDIIGGDFYWFSENNDEFIMAVVDCTGHGVPGAMMSMIGCSFLNEIVNHKKITKPSVILGKLNKRILSLLKTGDLESKSQDGMDISVCAINKVTNTIQFAGANRPLFHFRGDEMKIINGDKCGVGDLQGGSEREYTNHSFSYENNDVIYMFTDGYSDQFGGRKEKKMMTAKLVKLIRSTLSYDMRVQEPMLNQWFERWKGKLEQTDDILLLGVKLNDVISGRPDENKMNKHIPAVISASNYL